MAKRDQRTPEQKIADTLLSRKRPVTRDRLQVIAGLDNERQVRLAIESLRRKGLPIISSPHVAGYWIARDIAELKAYKARVLQKLDTEYSTTRTMQMRHIKKFVKEVK